MQIVQIIFGLILTFGSFYMLQSAWDGSRGSFQSFLLFIFLAYMGWANAFATIKITEDSVTVTVFYGRFRIKWNEVEKIVLKAPYIALIGNEKRIVLSLAFAGGNSKKMLEYFTKQIEARSIVFEQNGTPFPITHHNARVWR